MNKRNPSQVALQIKEVIPSSFAGYHSKLDSLIDDFAYKAPEQDPDCFFTLAAFCNEILFDTNWKLKMISILTTKSEKELSLIER